ncbi:MAG: hypothetical protein L0Z70_11695, partial [Chloroflexi bacterium]|nr:hypothetical protein [Chloroflexota bacterium]
ADLANYAALLPAEAAQKQALILGAGGAARAVVFALLQTGWQVTLAARRLEKARAILASIRTFLPVAAPHQLCISLTNLKSTISNLQISLLVNATPLGMSPHVHASPWPQDLPLPPGALVYDLVYNPAETALARQARRQGLHAVIGAGMLIEQAALAFERWMNVPAPRQAMRAAIEEALTP